MHQMLQIFTFYPSGTSLRDKKKLHETLEKQNIMPSVYSLLQSHDILHHSRNYCFGPSACLEGDVVDSSGCSGACGC